MKVFLKTQSSTCRTRFKRSVSYKQKESLEVELMQTAVKIDRQDRVIGITTLNQGTLTVKIVLAEQFLKKEFKYLSKVEDKEFSNLILIQQLGTITL